MVVPGSVQTPRAKDAADKLATSVEDAYRIAAAVIRLGPVTRGTGWDIGYATLFFVSDESSWITGQTLTADGGASVTVPASVLGRLHARGMLSIK